MTFGARYKCPRCDHIYSPEEYEGLESVWVIPENREYGKARVCRRCGALVSLLCRDRLVLKDYVELKHGVEVEVSTVDLVVEHEWGGEGGFFYETILWFSKAARSLAVVPCCDVVTRYRTKEEAVEGHRRIVEALRRGEAYRFVEVPRLIIDYQKLEKIAEGGDLSG